MKVSFFVPAKGARAQNQYSAPLGLGYLSSYLKKYQDISAVDLHVDLDDLLAGKPDIIGITAFSQDYSQAISYAEKIKKKSNVPIVIGGYHISALPKSLNKNFLAGII